MNKEKIILLVQKLLKEELNNIPKINLLVPFGSRTYGTSNKNSDYDFTVVFKHDKEYEFQYLTDKVDIHFVSDKLFTKLLQSSDIKSLEGYFCKDYIIKENLPEFKVDLNSLRHSISSIVSNSWVKAKKKVLLENEDNYTGYKSLFHSFRILMFGIELAKTNKIEDFSIANNYYIEVMGKMNNGENIEDIMKEYKPEHNKLMSEFRKLAPKYENNEITLGI
jgi:predicted nucleotidyltransferase